MLPVVGRRFHRPLTCERHRLTLCYRGTLRMLRRLRAPELGRSASWESLRIVFEKLEK